MAKLLKHVFVIPIRSSEWESESLLCGENKPQIAHGVSKRVRSAHNLKNFTFETYETGAILILLDINPNFTTVYLYTKSYDKKLLKFYFIID